MPRVELETTTRLHHYCDMSAAETLEAWRAADAVCFDVDSTVIRDEGLDQLANFCGKGDIIRKITQEAMRGGVDFREALRARLSLLRPDQDIVQKFIRTHPPLLTPGIKELVSELQSRGVDVYLISGGFLSLIAPVAAKLGIPSENVYANRLKFFFDGQYAGFDETQPTSRSGGKAEVVGCLQRKQGYECVVMVGDGATDMEACPPAQAFIGFGGNVEREAVKNKAPLYVTCFHSLRQQLLDPGVACPPAVDPGVACSSAVDPGVACPPAVDPEVACPPAVDPEVACPPAVDPGVACPPAVDPGVACPPSRGLL
ncbi:HAD-like domain [Trinorchestia longiramus]|nr:HAD-like domain [Trinorchestia longiramus]